jgi:hypothetical protein
MKNTFYVIQNIRCGYIKAKLTNRSEADTLCSRLNAELNYAHDRYKVVIYHA